MVRAVSLALLVILLIAACHARAPSDPVTVEGSSTAFPIAEAVAHEFMKAHSGAAINVTFSGTGTGFMRFCEANSTWRTPPANYDRRAEGVRRGQGHQWLRWSTAPSRSSEAQNPGPPRSRSTNSAHCGRGGNERSRLQQFDRTGRSGIRLFDPEPSPARSTTSPTPSTVAPASRKDYTSSGDDGDRQGRPMTSSRSATSVMDTSSGIARS